MILKELLDIDWDFYSEDEDSIYKDLLSLIKAIVEDDSTSLEEEDKLAQILLDEFHDDHEIWDYIEWR